MDVIEYGNRSADTVLIQPVSGHGLDSVAEEIEAIKKGAGEDLRFIAFIVDDWNRDLSPWKAPAVFGGDDFGDGAQETLSLILRYCTDRTKRYCIGGYSLAGLFALWAAYETDVFTGAAAASPSIWFPGFTDHMRERNIGARHVYLSLGKKEEKTRNRVMSTVGDRIREAHDVLSEQGADCVLEWNEGNHFRDAGLRTARAFLWIMKRLP